MPSPKRKDSLHQNHKTIITSKKMNNNLLTPNIQTMFNLSNCSKSWLKYYVSLFWTRIDLYVHGMKGLERATGNTHCFLKLSVKSALHRPPWFPLPVCTTCYRRLKHAILCVCFSRPSFRAERISVFLLHAWEADGFVRHLWCPGRFLLPLGFLCWPGLAPALCAMIVWSSSRLRLWTRMHSFLIYVTCQALF